MDDNDNRSLIIMWLDNSWLCVSHYKTKIKGAPVTNHTIEIWNNRISLAVVVVVALVLMEN